MLTLMLLGSSNFPEAKGSNVNESDLLYHLLIWSQFLNQQFNPFLLQHDQRLTIPTISFQCLLKYVAKKIQSLSFII
jgi:hypothetical protein